MNTSTSGAAEENANVYAKAIRRLFVSRNAVYGDSVTTTFIDRDADFERWRDDHPNAYIVNHDRVPTAEYLVLHRASCVRLRITGGANWTTTYGKTCGRTLDDIRSWATRTVGTLNLHRCHFCQPPAP